MLTACGKQWEYEYTEVEACEKSNDCYHVLSFQHLPYMQVTCRRSSLNVCCCNLICFVITKGLKEVLYEGFFIHIVQRNVGFLPHVKLSVLWARAVGGQFRSLLFGCFCLILIVRPDNLKDVSLPLHFLPDSWGHRAYPWISYSLVFYQISDRPCWVIHYELMSQMYFNLFR